VADYRLAVRIAQHNVFLKAVEDLLFIFEVGLADTLAEFFRR